MAFATGFPRLTRGERWNDPQHVEPSRWGRSMGVLVIGGGSVRNLKEFPPGCRAGDNAHAFLGGFRLRADPADRKSLTLAKTGS